MQLFWRIMILATIIWLAAMLLLATVPMAHGQESPLPTQLSTSWVATPGWTPTLHPWPPSPIATPTATPVPDQNIVYLPLIGGK